MLIVFILLKLQCHKGIFLYHLHHLLFLDHTDHFETVNLYLCELMSLCLACLADKKPIASIFCSVVPGIWLIRGCSAWFILPSSVANLHSGIAHVDQTANNQRSSSWLKQSSPVNKAVNHLNTKQLFIHLDIDPYISHTDDVSELWKDWTTCYICISSRNAILTHLRLSLRVS